MTVDELLPYLKQHGNTIRQAILEGTYVPQPVRRKQIPKPGGGVRQLGIPTVVDRVIQQAIAYLKSGVMVNGVVVDVEKGCPQGGPLSPLLSNIMLDELDKELEKRGHKFCRYADDFNIYVKSRRAGERVMRSITSFLEGKLKLQVNREKSAVDRPWKRKFLGFSFYISSGMVGIRVHHKPIKKFKIYGQGETNPLQKQRSKHGAKGGGTQPLRYWLGKLLRAG
jgi:retron-type reverse transcriptase